ncbi:DgyrCDS54 [Dimorphilus gyrociliatus]|uniref:DgyrCDS54 n=1 Tax=Dimorphilus gyrociliatus TaxID=2664684 RepID=A0A7I8V3Q4_9ANNE|nr:DgyrCDS54 [Dimorphilus gyrociliatus]
MIGRLAFIVCFVMIWAKDLKQEVICKGEDLNLECPLHRIINVSYATYGRVENKRYCNTEGDRPCETDLTEKLYSRVFGKREYYLPNPSSIFDKNGRLSAQCRSDRQYYLIVHYTCKLIGPNPGCSRSARRPTVSKEEREIYSAIVEDCDNNPSWTLQSNSGYVINFELLHYNNNYSLMFVPSGDDHCKIKLGRIKSGNDAMSICLYPRNLRGTSNAIEWSTTNSIAKVEFFTQVIRQQGANFKLIYKEHGCAQPQFSTDSSILLHRKNAYTFEVTCKMYEASTFEMRCEGGRWSPEINAQRQCGVEASSDEKLPIGVWVAVIIGMALVVSAIILVIGFVFLKRQRRLKELERRKQEDYSRAVYSWPNSGSVKGNVTASTRPDLVFDAEADSLLHPADHGIGNERETDEIYRRIALDPGVLLVTSDGSDLPEVLRMQPLRSVRKLSKKDTRAYIYEDEFENVANSMMDAKNDVGVVYAKLPSNDSIPAAI